MKNALWPQVKRACPVTLAGLGDPLCLQLPTSSLQGTKLTLPLLPTPSPPKPNETVTEHQSVIVILDLQGWRALWGSSGSKTPLKTGPTATRSLSLAGEQPSYSGSTAKGHERCRCPPPACSPPFAASWQVCQSFGQGLWFTLQPFPKVLPGLEDSLSLHLYCDAVLVCVFCCVPLIL